ncbi:protein mono-ADP-ribosyltransferase PARP14-like [Ruditapes philippinarum]|uniref:protein mono-ADP-ribosyltransferase PARP14-like n=1 Tax=Ruditapes philippinarum TaxID=129788 RepID=UPI00295B3FC6|nr:protein mono-ADP-ribosyltransferase PARP14-like [Ruditapes philippinarum]
MHHILGDRTLNVKRFQPILGRPEGETEERKLRLPPFIEIKDANIHKISFVTSSSKMKETFQQELIKTYTQIKWPTDIDHNVQLHCMLTRNDKNCFKIAKSWGKQAHAEFMRLLDTIILHRIAILQDIRQKVMSFLQNLIVKDSTNVAIVNKKEEHLIFVVGTKTAADDLKDVIEKGINKIIDAAEKEKQTVTEIFSNLENIETKMLIFQHFSKELEDKFDDLNVEIKTDRNEIHLKGQINNVKSAQLAIYDRKSNFEVTKIRDISKLALTLLQLESTRNALQCKLEAKSIRAVWEPTTDGIVVCCYKPSSIEKAVDIIRSFICNEQIAIKKGTVPDLETEKWRKKIEEIYSKHPGKVMISLDENQEKIHICTLADKHTLVKEEIQRFLEANTITTQIISNSKEINRFLEKNCRKEIEEIYLRHQQYYVKIIHLDQFRGLEVQGLQKGVQDAIQQIRILIKRIKHHTHTVTKPGIAEHISSPKGKDSIHTIEYSLECVIVVEGDIADKQMTEKELGTRSHTTFHGTTIYVWQGDMTELEVDVLVNPSDKNLASTGGLGKAIFTKGGQMIRHDCNDFIGRYGSLKDGEVFISSAGDLKAKNVVHIKSSRWENGTNMDKELESTVFMCLQKTANLQNKSIAIPAIGCGVNGFPVDISTSSIVNALKRILMEYQDSSLCEIYLCDMNTTNVEGFTCALQKVFGITNVVLDDGGKMDTSSHASFPQQMDAGIKSVSGSIMQRSYDGNGFSESISGHRKDESVVIGNVAVTVVKGEIAKQKADVIVNTTSNNLDLRNGAVSMSLSKSAGRALQDEVTAKFPDGLENKTIAVTGGHKLHCNFVFHTALSNYKDNNPKESITGLHKVIRECLECAQQHNCQSIALPAFGTGNLGYPRDVVAEEMFNAVIQFQNDNSNTSVQDVRFVIYQNDTQTLQAFKANEARVNDKLHSASIAGKTGHTDNTIGYDILHAIPSGTNQQTSGNFTFDSVNVMVKHGDITQENTDCIVNSTNIDLNLMIGKVSQKLMDKGGNALQEEIENHKSEMKRSKIVTTLAPGLPCKHIIHVVPDSKDVAATVKKCLKEAENEKMNSIAMPVFGTGKIYAGSKTVDPGTVIDVAKNMFKAIREISKSQPRYIKEVRLVIFQTELLPEFLKAAEDVADSNSWYGNIWKGVKNALGMSGPSHENSDTTFKTRPDYNSVSFIIIAMKDEVIRKAIKKLDSSLEKEMHTKIIDDHTICQLEDIQVDEMHGIAQQCHVQMTMDKNKATIKLAGIVTNVMNASDKISTLLRDAERMEFLKNIAQWFYIEVSQTGEQVLPYGKDINMIIENAYKRQRSTVEYSVGDSDFILDFASMEEYPENNISDKVKVIRRDLVKGGSFELPATWDDMKGGNLRVVNLTSGSTEYTAIEKQFKDSAGQYKDTSGQCQDWVVEKIERVQNKVLWEQYQSKKKQLEKQNPSGTINERELWHGTSAEPVDSINAHGFNRSFCGKNATVFGDGVYFAIDAKYSCQDTYSKPDTSRIKRMYLCKVLTGVYAKGERGMRVPPSNPNGGPHALYDSVTNDTNKPHMFIIFHDTQACPEYLIYFK